MLLIWLIVRHVILGHAIGNMLQDAISEVELAAPVFGRSGRGAVVLPMGDFLIAGGEIGQDKGFHHWRRGLWRGRDFTPSPGARRRGDHARRQQGLCRKIHQSTKTSLLLTLGFRPVLRRTGLFYSARLVRGSEQGCSGTLVP